MTSRPQPTAAQIHQAEARHAEADEMLEQVLQLLRANMPMLSDVTGLSDASVLFEYILQFITNNFQDDPPSMTVWTSYTCSAALTRLARTAPRADDPLARLEKEISDDNHRNG